MLSDICSDHLCVTIFPCEERPTKHMLETLAEGDAIRVSVPCGSFALDKEAVRTMDRVVVAGKATDGGAVLAVGKALAAHGVTDVTLIVEENDKFGNVAHGHGLIVKLVDKITADMIACSPEDKCGLFILPSLIELAEATGCDAVIVH
jgi:hypothetical protein